MTEKANKALRILGCSLLLLSLAAITQAAPQPNVGVCGCSKCEVAENSWCNCGSSWRLCSEFMEINCWGGAFQSSEQQPFETLAVEASPLYTSELSQEGSEVPEESDAPKGSEDSLRADDGPIRAQDDSVVE